MENGTRRALLTAALPAAAGDNCSRERKENLPNLVAAIAKKEGYVLKSRHADAIPNERRVRRGIVGSSSETILVLRNAKLRRVSAG